ncbi:hypothetical protein B0H14DRAFT_2640458 [Mycena olivaceomarginata]|nr:hypothetical protein B0H14DRAFT_2640458 [Mycena olivaceomarginata]
MLADEFAPAHTTLQLVYLFLALILTKFPRVNIQCAALIPTVQGADHARYTFAASGAKFDVEADFDCDLKGGKAECPVTDSKSRVGTFTFSTLQSFVIDVASTAPPSATGKPNSSPGLSASRSGALRHWWARLYWSRTG